MKPREYLKENFELSGNFELTVFEFAVPDLYYVPII